MVAAAAAAAPLGAAGDVPSSILNHGGHLDPDLVLFTQPWTLLDLGRLVDLAELLGLGRPASMWTPVAAAAALRGADVAPIPKLAGPK